MKQWYLRYWKRILAGAVACLIIFGIAYFPRSHTKVSGAYAPLKIVDTSGALGTQNAFVQVVKLAKPSVVQITTEKTITYRYWNPFGDLEDMFRNPFEDFMNPRQRQPRQRPKTFEKKQEGLGSGFIVDENGYILTNNHVIEGVDKILVKFFDDEKKYVAKVIGTDPKTDLALIKIETGKALTAIPLANSDTIDVGEWAIAIGNPMGLEETVTVGIVSAKGRSGFGITQYEDFIQTDAAINPGNSGGPLLNIRGEVIGINTFILAPYTAQNIGFAIPVNLAKKIFSELKTHGKVTRGFLGVSLRPLTPELAQSFGLSNQEGALVREVIPNTPAEKAGIREGDIILTLNNSPVKNETSLTLMVADTKVGETVTLTIWRNKKKSTLSLKLIERPADEELASTQGEKRKGWRGISVSNITPEIRERLGITGTVKGAFIAAIEEGSLAEEANLKPGMIILKLNDTLISNAKEFSDATLTIEEKASVRLWVQIAPSGLKDWFILKGK
ncbi:MAG: DegQ family serine endoprotease [Candidatus Ratteibacteria bacterium]|jgi:serine protease Do